jgi:uncharacterized protein with ATP-grasp and redox domains
MKTCLDCIPCFVRQTLDSVRLMTADEEIHEEILRRTLSIAADIDMRQPPPAVAQKIHRVIRQLTGDPDPYRNIKSKYNTLALEMYPQLKAMVENSLNPFETAVRLSAAGNIIDFGVNSTLAEHEVHNAIDECLHDPLNGSPLDEFRTYAQRAAKILYIADNAGEIVFDRLLIERLDTSKVTCAVKGAPILNDATVDDAHAAGLTQIVEVIDNGSDAPGTILGDCSQSFLEHFDRADLVIAKGQGNYETLNEIDKNIFFILRVKCPAIAKDLDHSIGSLVVDRSRALKKEILEPN